MEDKTIKLLYINSDVRALVNINLAPAGETGLGAITQPIASDASFFVSMLPLENAKNFIYLPYTRRVSIAGGGTVVDNDGLIDLCIWPDNIVELTLYPQAVYKNEETEMLPSVLSPFDFYIDSEAHTAFIYNEVCSSFAIEHSTSSRLRFISPLPFFVHSADISFMRLGDLPVIYVTGKTMNDEKFLYAASIRPEIRTAICSVCAAYEIDKSGLSIITDGEFRQVRTRYENRDSHLTPVEKSLGWFTCSEQAPATPHDVCASLLQAVRAGMSEAAMACLTPSLADGLGFSDLKDFFGDFLMFTDTISPACGQSGIALKYATGKHLFSAREFCIETKKSGNGLLIDNIREP